MSASPREPIPEALRRAVFHRDRGTCWVCHRTRRLTIDHILPVAMGGTDASANLRTMCFPCNRERGTTYLWFDRPRTPVAFACESCNLCLREGTGRRVLVWCDRCRRYGDTDPRLIDWVPLDRFTRGENFPREWFPVPGPSVAEIVAGWRANGFRD